MWGAPSCAGRSPRSRRFRGTLVGAWPWCSPTGVWTPDHTDDALLVINELLTNAVEHARTRLILAVSFTGTALVVEVRDESVAEPQLQPVDLQAARGRGLQFVDALARPLELDRGRGGQDRVGRDLDPEPRQRTLDPRG